MVSHSCNPKTPEEDQEFKVALNDIKPVKREQEGGEKRENRKKNRGSPGLQLNTKSSEPTHF